MVRGKFTVDSNQQWARDYKTDVSSHDHKVVQVTNTNTWTSLGSCGNRRRALIFVLHFIEMKWVRRNRERSVTVLESMMKDLDRFQAVTKDFALVFFLTHHFNEMKWGFDSNRIQIIKMWKPSANNKTQTVFRGARISVEMWSFFNDGCIIFYVEHTVLVYEVDSTST